MSTDEDAIQALYEAALRHATPPVGASYVLPAWPPEDPRWKVLELALWPVDGFLERVAGQVRQRIREEYAARLRALLDSGKISRVQMVHALGVTFAELDAWLAP